MTTCSQERKHIMQGNKMQFPLPNRLCFEASSRTQSTEIQQPVRPKGCCLTVSGAVMARPDLDNTYGCQQPLHGPSWIERSE
ncbi:hypothetical protein ElyMa_005416700 [Elysia marginata]|uniref:Uncharacterized protein n=1 Tax=Elysia marginata TaxID=1093978 RepID=A0AAV4EIS0_9GAST|nr:hypothetical protein ElyMa_005416700 [Elysia marginata]